MSNPKATKAKEIYSIVQKLNTPIKLRLLLEDIKKNDGDFWNDLDIQNWSSLINHRIEDMMDEEVNRVVGDAIKGD